MSAIALPPPRRKAVACTCSAYPFPHRLYGGKCRGPDVCPHGVYLPHHPDYDPLVDHCPECAFWERVDYEYDRRMDR
jgi:hypothetical protein